MYLLINNWVLWLLVTCLMVSICILIYIVWVLFHLVAGLAWSRALSVPLPKWCFVGLMVCCYPLILIVTIVLGYLSQSSVKFWCDTLFVSFTRKSRHWQTFPKRFSQKYLQILIVFFVCFLKSFPPRGWLLHLPSSDMVSALMVWVSEWRVLFSPAPTIELLRPAWQHSYSSG